MVCSRSSYLPLTPTCFFVNQLNTVSILWRPNNTLHLFYTVMNDKVTDTKKNTDTTRSPDPKRVRRITGNHPSCNRADLDTNAVELSGAATTSDNVIDNVLSPSLANANLNDDNNNGCWDPESTTDDDSGDEYSPPDEQGDEDEDEDFLISLDDDLEQQQPGKDEVEVEEMIPNVDLELEDLDNVKEGDKEEDGKRRVLKIVVKEGSDLLAMMKESEFKRNYNSYPRTNSDVKQMNEGIMRKIVEFIVFTEGLDISQYKTAAELERILNEKRDEIGEALAQALRTKGHDDLASKINLGSRFSVETLMVFYLHYAPEGCTPVEGVKFDYCHPHQCCIHTMFSKVPNFVVNENEHGAEQMKQWKFGGKGVKNTNKNMAAVDLIPFLLQKKKKDAEMREQYEQIAGKLGLPSYLDLMIIPFCISQLHIKLFQKQQEEKADAGGELEEASKLTRLEFHFCSAASSSYILGYPKGVQKYQQRFVFDSFCLSVGPHPQVWLMGCIKSRVLFPKETAEMIAETIVLMYSCLHRFSPGFKSQIHNIFGPDCGGLDLAMHNHLAKKLRDADLLQLDALVASQSNGDDASSVKNIFDRNGLSLVLSSFVIGEMKTITLERVMDRIRKCSASHMYPQLAKKLRDADLLQLDALVAKESSSTLTDILDRHGLSTDVSSFITEEMKTVSLKQVMDRIRKCSDNHERLLLLPQLAKRSIRGEDGVTIKDDNDFKRYCQLTQLHPDKAIARVEKTAKRYKKTFRKYFNQLEQYMGRYPNHMEIVGGERILIIDDDMDEYHKLSKWLKAMVGYLEVYTNYEQQYGIMAYKEMGSVEQMALENIGVCFNPEKFKKAMDQRLTKRLSDKHDQGGTKANLMKNDFWGSMP
eukprot:scaffold8686_cov122-Skeletonema_menzelii.AAC.3